MSWVVLSKTIPAFVGMKNWFYLIKWSQDHSLNHVLHLENVGEMWWCTRLCFPLTVFLFIPSKAESPNNRAYILYSTCVTRKQVDNTFTVTIKLMFYFVTLLCNKTLEDVWIVNIKASLTFTFVTTRWSTFTWKRVYFSPNQMLSKTKRNKRRRCKYILNLFLSI